jgi:hypothetical protein
MLDRETRTLDQALDIAVEVISDGDPSRGRAALSWILEQDSRNRTAWIWMACCVADEPARQECYRRASVTSGE